MSVTFRVRGVDERLYLNVSNITARALLGLIRCPPAPPHEYLEGSLPMITAKIRLERITPEEIEARVELPQILGPNHFYEGLDRSTLVEYLALLRALIVEAERQGKRRLIWD